MNSILFIASMGALLVSQPFAAFEPSSRLIDIGTHRVEVVRAGSGSPPLIFEAGLGDALDAWSHVLPDAAKMSSVVAYSRSGLGRSEAGPTRHNAQTAVDELHALIGALHLKPPFVLVGASYGGMLVRLYTSRYPSEVAGLVIVEGVHEQQVKRFGELDPAYPAAFRKSFDEQLLTEPPGAGADEIRETVRIQEAGRVDGMKPLPDVPIAVLTSMKSDPNAQYVNATPRGHEAWRAMHDEWFRRSTNGIHIETSRSGHHIQDEEPQLVIDAIRFVLDRVSRPGSPAPTSNRD